MIRLLQLLVAPFEYWAKVSECSRGVVVVLLLTAMPMMLIGSAIEGWAMVHWGLAGNNPTQPLPVKMPQDMVVRFGMYRLGIDLLTLVMGAKFVQWFAEGAQVRTSYTATFKLVSYCLGPIWVFSRMLDGIPFVDSWLCWAGGALLMLYLLYHGVGLVLKPDQTKGFGLYLTSALMLTLLAGVSEFAGLTLLRRLM